MPIKVNLKLNNDKKDTKKNKKKSKKKKKNEIIEDDEEFYFYCYNDNSHSTNSLSTKSEHDKSRIRQENISYKESNNNDNYNLNKINDFLSQNKKTEKNNQKALDFPPKNKLSSFLKINTGNISKNKICLRANDFEEYFKDLTARLKNSKINEYNISHDDAKSPKIENEQNQKVIYKNVLDELSSSKSSTKSNFSMKNLNSYSKKTHRAKFNSNQSARFSPKNFSLSNV